MLSSCPALYAACPPSTRATNTTVVGLSLTTLGNRGRGQMQSTGQQTTNDRHLLITLGAELCVQGDGRQGVTQRVARGRLRQLRPDGGPYLVRVGAAWSRGWRWTRTLE